MAPLFREGIETSENIAVYVQLRPYARAGYDLPGSLAPRTPRLASKEPSTPNPYTPKPQTLNPYTPKPQTLNPKLLHP